MGLRLTWFAVGSWLVVARASPNLLARLPARWRRVASHVSRWARFGARCLRVRVRSQGPLPSPGSLVVANHQGYVDILVIGGLFPTVFAARHDMRSWPVLGALAVSGSTIFINRDNRRAGARGVAALARALAARATVVAFPEGTGTDGTGLLPLRTGVFQAAVDAGVPVVPASIRYLSLDGEPVTSETHHMVGWYGNETFMEHLVRLGRCRRIEAEVTFGEPIAPPHPDRRTLAAGAEERLRELLGFSAEDRPTRTGRDADTRSAAE